MRFLTVVLMASLMSITFTLDAEAQLFNRLKKKAKAAASQKAEEKLSERVERAAEQMVEDSWNSVFGEMSADSGAYGGMLFSMNSNVTTEDAYHFDTITTMEITTEKKDGTSEPPVTMDMHFNEGEMYTGTRFSSEEMKKENGDLFIIYDVKNSAMVMLMENEKDKFSFAYDWKQALEMGEDMGQSEQGEDDINWDEVDEWQGYTKIGSKHIQGYECDGYRSENNEGVVEVWVTRDESLGMHNMFKAHSNAKQVRGKIPEDYPYGMMMEMTSEDLESGDKTVMRVTDINKNAQVTYSMSNYPTMSLAAQKGK